jgi:small-conductance mechanosensitive channel
VQSASFWDRLAILLGLEEPGEVATLVRVIQVLLLVLLTVFLSRWLRGRVERAARANPSYVDIGSIASRVVGLVIYVVGITLILAALGANWTVLATVLGAATLGISLSLQDVGRNFVDGIYVLVERPYRLGDRVRIGAAEGRVEEIGVRMTKLRTADGEQISIPNNLVFTSVIENASIGSLERRRFIVKGITRPVPEIEEAVAQALAGLPSHTSRAPVVSLVSAGPEGAEIEVSVEHPANSRLNEQVIGGLRERFPEATVSLQQKSGES